VQHLDPTHESMMVDLLASHTTMPVQQAIDGAPIEPEHLYVIPPGTYLSVSGGAIHLSQPQAAHGARLPFDFLLHSLASSSGEQAICVILSGTGADGSLGAKTIKEKGGLVIAQNPDEADYDGMPRSAIDSGAVDFILPVAEIPAALIKYQRRISLSQKQSTAASSATTPAWLSEIIELLRERTAHNFTLYKRGTLQRRIARRMALASIEANSMDRYLDFLHSDPKELELLAKDLLINVTNFFRDPKVFDLLAEKIVPELVRNQPLDRPLRIWVAGCSTGEEAYSIAMIFREAIIAAKKNIKLQVFASDVDADAIVTARTGLYPESIEAEVSPERLSRFFSKEGQSYRVSPDLRAAIVFTVQDVLIDPPFSSLDFISCRNLMIYLSAEAQTKILSLFNFALRQGGILLLGNAETIGDVKGRFDIISKPERLYRHIGQRRLGEGALSLNAVSGLRPLPLPLPSQTATNQAAFGDLCQRLVIKSFAPAAILINSNHQCLYFLGSTDRYLVVPSGHPTHDLLALVDLNIRSKLRTAIQKAAEQHVRVVVAGGQTTHKNVAVSFSIDVQPVLNEHDELFLVCFIDEPARKPKADRKIPPEEVSRVAELEQELEATRSELQGSIRKLELANENQMAINEEALSVNEEFQSTNEELLTSKEELQSLNEELTALNTQLQESLERQRTTSDDMQNILNSTNVATIFLDRSLKIRFFTPATRSLFNLIPSDIGRPLADLSALAPDADLLTDAETVLRTLAPSEREITDMLESWYNRRILPYLTEDNRVEGVVVTFADITERRHGADLLELAKQQADTANLSKSRFLAAASHDLRQPLQTLTLIQVLLAKNVHSAQGQKLVTQLDATIGLMSGMLNSLLNINQIETGALQPEIINFPINALLSHLQAEFSYHAKAQGLSFHVVPCSLTIQSDPLLLEQMVRNLLANAFKYTKEGTVLLGCRRHNHMLSIEVWDTGDGIPEDEIETIFNEYCQLDNAPSDRDIGLGLGLSIVKRLGDLLEHGVRVHSLPNKGSTFAIEVPFSASKVGPLPAPQQHETPNKATKPVVSTGKILVVEDDRNVRDLLEIFLTGEGFDVTTAVDGVEALDLVEKGAVRPDLLLADRNLPKGMSGTESAAKIRKKLPNKLPVIILTGDISANALSEIAFENCVKLSKPVKVQDLLHVIHRLLPKSRSV
ncbi:MAG TPA: histidine kinase, partial [Rhodospirillaceae bacterium]|nr:histidine kinase [Rhodospirillaceae bacterium]